MQRFKSILITFLLLAALIPVKGQLKQEMPPFKIRLTSGAGYTFQEIKSNQPVVLIYFDTDCDHCMEFAKELMKPSYHLADKQIIWITYQNMKKTLKFDNMYKISSAPNCKIGSEGYTFVVQKFYNINKFPFVILFNKTHKLEKVLSTSDAPALLAKQISSFH